MRQEKMGLCQTIGVFRDRGLARRGRFLGTRARVGDKRRLPDCEGCRHVRSEETSLARSGHAHIGQFGDLRC